MASNSRTQDSGRISRLLLRGYKSIGECDLELRSLNVLIGANGAGKSNFIGFFRLVNEVIGQQLQRSVTLAGGADAVLRFGRKVTDQLDCTIEFSEGARYGFSLEATVDNRLAFSREVVGILDGVEVTSQGYLESQAHLYDSHGNGNALDSVLRSMRSWTVYHFHDTGPSARVKQVHNIHNNVRLQDDARNLAAYLLMLKQVHPEHYGRIVKVIRLVAPYFGDFHLRPVVGNEKTIQLEWTEAGQSEPFTASALSDGTLRFMCLATVLLQPEALMPSTLLIDEPELGLHPFAVQVLAGLMKSLSHTRQLIISTQSVALVDEFQAEDLIIVDKHQGASRFKRLDVHALKEWLAQYSLGDLWQKNLLGGRPGR
ncbi:AAA family ATPase [Roseateles sp.]|uniref:AAA family ATPase n=1 Tax=Roseateles sp. TaxID=1971397 RepID=UPI0031DF8E70